MKIPYLLIALTAVVSSAPAPGTTVPKHTILSTREEIAARLPDGLYFGSNNADGTTTMKLNDTSELFTFTPHSRDQVLGRRSDIVARHIGHSDCWTFQSQLDHDATDLAIIAVRNLAASSHPYTLGINKDGPWYGYKHGAVFAYFCANTPDGNYHDIITYDDVQSGTYYMDQDCGAYNPGFFQWDSFTLFGKTWVGTQVCIGSGHPFDGSTLYSYP